ncbi:TPA: helix-turn-helix domain-containing protein [Enterococcus faecalis]
MNNVFISLSDEQLNDLQSTVYLNMKKEIERAREDCRLEQTYMTKKETCTYLHVSNNTLDKFIESGLPKVVLAGITRFNRQTIDQWLTKNFEK